VGDESIRETELRRETELTEWLVSYLRDNPNPCDEFTAIADLWIPKQKIRAELDLLSRVLDRLVAEQVLEVSGHGPRARYRVKQR
jgi:hypothetical protein